MTANLPIITSASAAKRSDSSAEGENCSDNENCVRIGQINFINSLPFNLPIEKGLVDISYRSSKTEFISAVPRFLNEELKASRLQISSVSSWFLVENPDYIALPDISISSDGDVGSVLFFHKKPLSRLNRVAVPNTSATSIRLLALILELEAGSRLKFETVVKPDIDAEEYDGVLIIGDEALRIEEEWRIKADCIDLGGWWKNRFSLPMVFGMWAAAPHFVEQDRKRFRHICSGLSQARDLGTGILMKEVLERAAIESGLSEERIHRYFNQELDFAYDERHAQSFRLYEELCHKHDLL